MPWPFTRKKKPLSSMGLGEPLINSRNVNNSFQVRKPEQPLTNKRMNLMFKNSANLQTNAEYEAWLNVQLNTAKKVIANTPNNKNLAQNSIARAMQVGYNRFPAVVAKSKYAPYANTRSSFASDPRPPSPQPQLGGRKRKTRRNRRSRKTRRN